MLAHPRRFVAMLAISACLLQSSHAIAAQPVPDLTLKIADGGLALQDLKGEVVYVDFWASWCAPCRKSFPWMNDMQARYAKQGLRVVAVNVDKDPATAREFLQRNPARFTIAYDPDGKAAARFAVKGMPSSYLIDRNGNIHATHIGFKEKDTANMEAQLKALLAN